MATSIHTRRQKPTNESLPVDEQNRILLRDEVPALERNYLSVWGGVLTSAGERNGQNGETERYGDAIVIKNRYIKDHHRVDWTGSVERITFVECIRLSLCKFVCFFLLLLLSTASG